MISKYFSSSKTLNNFWIRVGGQPKPLVLLPPKFLCIPMASKHSNLSLYHLWFDCKYNSKLLPISVFWNHSPAAAVIFPKWKSDHCTMVLLCLQDKIQTPYRSIQGLSWSGSCLSHHLLSHRGFLSHLYKSSIRPQKVHYISQNTPCPLYIAGLLRKPSLTPNSPEKVLFTSKNHWSSLYPVSFSQMVGIVPCV